MEDHKVDAGHSLPQDHAHTQRRLARGLEDVSHLFLSQTTNEATAGGEARDGPAEQTQPQPAEPAFIPLLHPFPDVNRDQLVSLLESHIALLEEGMRAIDVNIPCDPYGPIDLLAVDSANKLVIIDLDTSANDELLLRGICHFDWLVRNVPIARRMYRGHVIDFSANPRLFLVAPDYSPRLRCVTCWITCPQISCFRYHAVALRNGAGILVERA